MERKDFENIATELLITLKDLYEAAYPDSSYLNLSIIGNTISINNDYLETDKEYPINVLKHLNVGKHHKVDSK